MMPALAQAPVVITNDRPAYRVLNPVFLDDCLYEPGECIYFDDMPNVEMEPLNDIARERMQSFIDMVNEEGRKWAEKTGKTYSPLTNGIDMARELETQTTRRVQLIEGDGGIPIMRGRKKMHSAKIEAAPVPTLGGRGKLSIANTKE